MAVLGIVGTVLLVLLKIVLIVLLLVLAIALLVLFVPVRYGVWLEKEEAFSARVRVSWLCHLVCFRMLYGQGEEPELILRVFGFNLLTWLQRRRERADRSQEDEADSVQKDAGETGSGQGAFVKMDLAGEDFEEDGNVGDSEETDIFMAELRLPGNEEDGRDREDIWDGGLFRAVARRICRLWKEFIRRLRGIADFFKGLRKIACKLCKRAEWLGEVKDFWHSENTRQMVCIFRDNVLHLWRKLKPGTVKGQVWFGTGNPCSTGQVLGACAMLFAYYGNGITVTPDFERRVLEGKLMLKGHLSLITAVVVLVKVFFSRQWKTFRREWDVIGGSFNE